MLKVGSLVKLLGFDSKKKNIIGTIVNIRYDQYRVFWITGIPDYIHRPSLSKTNWLRKELQKLA